MLHVFHAFDPQPVEDADVINKRKRKNAVFHLIAFLQTLYFTSFSKWSWIFLAHEIKSEGDE